MGPVEAIDASIPGGKKDGWWLKDPRGTWHQMLVPLKSRSELHSNGQRENCILKGAVKGAYRCFHPVLLLLLQASEVGEKKPWHVAVFGNGGILITERANESGTTGKDKARE